MKAKESYRSVSISPDIAKIFKKLLRKQITFFIDEVLWKY